MDTDRYVSAVLRKLIERYGEDLETELAHQDPVQLFVAVLLSPQCTDKQVNNVTPALFRRYKSFKDYSNADTRELQRYLSGINYYKTKARHLKKAAEIIISRYNGKVPKTLDQLMELPGVGRKVANVTLNELYDINQGIAVDTHCARVARRVGLSRWKDPHKIESDLMRKVPPDEWGEVSNLFITLGRDACKARDKQCYRCVLKRICPSSTELQ